MASDDAVLKALFFRSRLAFPDRVRAGESSVEPATRHYFTFCPRGRTPEFALETTGIRAPGHEREARSAARYAICDAYREGLETGRRAAENALITK